MPEMQEQFLIARDGVNAEKAGAIFGRLWPGWPVCAGPLAL
jgi:hypothetical protein